MKSFSSWAPCPDTYGVGFRPSCRTQVTLLALNFTEAIAHRTITLKSGKPASVATRNALTFLKELDLLDTYSCGLRSVAYGPWPTVCGLWFVAYGLWPTVCGLRAAARTQQLEHTARTQHLGLRFPSVVHGVYAPWKTGIWLWPTVSGLRS